MNSIQGRLLRRLLPALIGILLVFGLTVYAFTASQVRRLLDAELVERAWVLAQWTVGEPRSEGVIVPARVERELRELVARMHRMGLPRGAIGATSTIEYQIRLNALPEPLRSSGMPRWGDAQPGFSTASRQGDRWHLYTLEFGSPAAVVTVAERASWRQQVVHAALLAPMLGSLMLLLVVVFVVWSLVRSGLKPVRAMAAMLATRRADALAPLEVAAPAEIAPLVAAFNDLLDRLRRRLEEERLFTAAAAHELRTPLAGIRLQAELGLNQPETAASRELRSIVDRSQHAERVLDQFLQLAALDANDTSALKRHRTDLNQLVHSTIDALRSDAEAAGVRLAVQVPIGTHWLVEPVSLGVLLRNLIDNAIRYTHPGDVVRIQVSAEDKLQIEVRDSGPGIDPCRVGRLVKPFRRGSEQDRRGSGLGLAIVQRVVDLHGGQLELITGDDKAGLTARVRIS